MIVIVNELNMFVDKDDLIVINSIYLGMIDYCIVLMKNNGMM